MACWGMAILPDNLKSRYQTAPEGKYRGFMDVYRAVVKEEGYGALFTGFRPAMIRKFRGCCLILLFLRNNKRNNKNKYPILSYCIVLDQSE